PRRRRTSPCRIRAPANEPSCWSPGRRRTRTPSCPAWAVDRWPPSPRPPRTAAVCAGSPWTGWTSGLAPPPSPASRPQPLHSRDRRSNPPPRTGWLRRTRPVSGRRRARPVTAVPAARPGPGLQRLRHHPLLHDPRLRASAGQASRHRPNRLSLPNRPCSPHHRSRHRASRNRRRSCRSGYRQNLRHHRRHRRNRRSPPPRIPLLLRNAPPLRDPRSPRNPPLSRNPPPRRPNRKRQQGHQTLHRRNPPPWRSPETRTRRRRGRATPARARTAPPRARPTNPTCRGRRRPLRPPHPSRPSGSHCAVTTTPDEPAARADPGRSCHRGRYVLRGGAALVDQPRPPADHRAADAGHGAAGPGRAGAGTGATGTPRPAGTGCGRPDRGQPDPRPRAGRGADSGHPPGLLPRPDRSDAAVPVRTRPTRTAAAGARGGVGWPRAGCRRTAHPALVPGATRRRGGRRPRAGRDPRHQLSNPLLLPARARTHGWESTALLLPAEHPTPASSADSPAESSPRWRATVARIRDNEPMTNDPAFDMEGITWHPVSPRLAPVRVVTAVITLGIPFLAGLVLARVFGGWVWTAPVVVAA